MQTQYGLSYKDAAHRLYLAEVAGIQSNFDAQTAFAAVKNCICNTVKNNICNPVEIIDVADGVVRIPHPDGYLLPRVPSRPED